MFFSAHLVQNTRWPYVIAFCMLFSCAYSPFPVQALFFTSLWLKNIVGNEEIAGNKQYLLFPQNFLPYRMVIFQMSLSLNCRLNLFQIGQV